MNEAYLLLGTNQGQREENLLLARLELAARVGRLVILSGLYQTAAWGLKEQPDFLNQAVLIQTNLTPTLLLAELKAIEKETGRITTEKWGPRVLDIDILFYDNQVINLPELTIPHPYIPQRRFTLAPLNEIAPGYQHPLLKKTIAELLADCPDTSEVKKTA